MRMIYFVINLYQQMIEFIRSYVVKIKYVKGIFRFFYILEIDVIYFEKVFDLNYFEYILYFNNFENLINYLNK